MNKFKEKLIYVWIGDNLPDWSIIAINLSVISSNSEVILLTTKKNNQISKKCTQIELSSFYIPKNNVLINSNFKFRDNFWYRTTERFFILNQFIKKFNIENFFHAELDNMIFDLENLSSKLNSNGSGFFVPRDNSNRCIASLIYINNSKVLEDFTNFCYNNQNPTSNDMTLLSDFSQNTPFFSNLPTEIVFNSNNDWKFIDHLSLDGIFDAAAIGQYLFGIDPRNSRFLIFNQFENENLKVDLKKSKFTLEKNKATLNGVNLYNIHVHSKIFKKIINKIWLDKLVDRINNGKKTYITNKYLDF